ncbi:unnamed protein product [Closterium sp. NIES-65]|nr:unnamed protein product [Closterium sp. NIES-65]
MIPSDPHRWTIMLPLASHRIPKPLRLKDAHGVILRHPLCAALFTVAASASLFPAALRDGGVTAASAAQTKPLAWKGKTIAKYMTKLRPTKLNGRLVGDKGAPGKYVLKAVRYSPTSYYITYYMEILHIRSEGKMPTFSAGASCAATALGQVGQNALCGKRTKVV